MPSRNTSETARANGAKSRGPVTPEGRARSSRNSLRHGLAASSPGLPPVNVVLTTESREDFQTLLDSYLHQFAPQTGLETELVHAMAAARWRLRRIAAMETMLLNNEMLRRAEDMDADFEEHNLTNVQSIDRVTFTFQKLAEYGQSLSLLLRYEGTLNRSHDRAFKQLQLLQSARLRVQPNEPKPVLLVSNQPVPEPEDGTAPSLRPGKEPILAGPRVT